MRLGHEKEAVCIVSGEGVHVRRSMRLGHENEAVCMGCMWGDRGWVAENKVVCIVSRMCVWGDRRRLGHEREAVCIVIGGGEVCGEIDAGWVAESKTVCICG